MSARAIGDLWKYNLAKVVVVDVTDDYKLMQEPLPAQCYPILSQTYVPIIRMQDDIQVLELVDGFLYDWHLKPETADEPWVIAVVNRSFAQEICHATGS